MQNLYQAQQTAKEEATTVRAMGEKIRRLEHALDEAQMTKRCNGEADFVASLESSTTALRHEVANLTLNNHNMRNCDNCDQVHCHRCNDTAAIQDCSDSNRSYWEMG